MSSEDLKTKTEEIDAQISESERLVSELYSELGKKLFLELGDESEQAPLVAKIKDINAKLEALHLERANLEEEYNKNLAARTCFVCKYVNPEDARFCEECGTRLGAPPREYCKACNTMNKPGQKFCGECGTRLE